MNYAVALARFREWAPVWAPLAGVAIGGWIAYRTTLRLRRVDRLVESRAALAGALEECLSATESHRSEFSIWLARPEPAGGPLSPEPPASLAAVKRYMLETRGRVRSAFARLAALDRAENLDELSGFIDGMVHPDVGVEKIAELRGKVLAFVKRWRA